MSYQTITLKQLDILISQGKLMELIDLRSPEAYRAGHIRGARNIPYEEIMDRLEELPNNRPLVFYCSRGGQSMVTCRDLSRMGYQVVNVANGFSSYRGAYFTS